MVLAISSGLASAVPAMDDNMADLLGRDAGPYCTARSHPGRREIPGHRITARIADRVAGGPVVGVDTSPDMIARATREYGPGAPRAAQPARRGGRRARPSRSRSCAHSFTMGCSPSSERSGERRRSDLITALDAVKFSLFADIKPP